MLLFYILYWNIKKNLKYLFHKFLLKIPQNMKVLIKVLNPLCEPQIKGDWIDLKSASDCLVTPPMISGKTVKFTKYLIPLGVCMELPYGFEAHVVPRSSTFKLLSSK